MEAFLNFLNIHSPLAYFTQSIWRDEAFSILAAEKPLTEILPKLSFEPPVYYTLLHFWIKIFGNSEIAARSLSLFAFSLATVAVIEWSDRYFRKTFLTWYLPLIFFLNPMLLYYAFEIRTYGWYILFATLSIITFIEKKWLFLAIVNILGFYTHSYFIFLPFTQCIYYLISRPKKIKNILSLITSPYIRSLFVSMIFILPWLFKILVELPRLKQSWYFPVDIQLVKSVLGNIFMGYEGTPWFVWKYTAYLSGLIIILSLIPVFSKRNRRIFTYLLTSLYLPLFITIGISFFKPLFVNRYLIQCTVAMIFLLALSISLLKNHLHQKTLAALILAITLFINFWYPSRHPKVPIRDTILTINQLARPTDLWYAESPLILFETLYYAGDRSRVYLYNPQLNEFPWYVGDAVFDNKYIADKLPVYPERAFIISENGDFNIRYIIPER